MEIEPNYEGAREEAETPSQNRHSPDYLLPGSIIFAGILIAGSIIYVVGRSSGNSVPPVAGTANVIDQAGVPPAGAREVALGEAGAPVTFIEYGDYQCPFCARFFAQSEGKIIDNYVKTGKVKLVFRNFQFLGPESVAAAQAAECAKDQNKYWPYHDALFTVELNDARENNGNLNRDLFMKLAGDLGLNVTVFAGCIDSQKYIAQVQDETEAASNAGVNSTPTAFVNNQKILGALPYEEFAKAIDAELKNN